MWERRLRIASGLILALYVLGHFANHALGVFSFDAMERTRWVLSAVWQSPPGTFALYGSFLVHFVVALRSLYRRTTLRMPGWEAVQIILGFLIPVLLASHVIGTRLSRELLEFDITYPYVVTILWNNSWLVIKQPVLMLVVWAHVAVGVHYWLRLRPWYGKALPYVFAFAVILPVLALLGFVRAGLSSDELGDAALAQIFEGWTNANPDTRAFILSLEGPSLFALGLLIGAVLLGRRLRHFAANRAGMFHLRHSNGRVLRVALGQSVLEALRSAGVPHASVCGGRARCTTCRIRIDEGSTELPLPVEVETRALRRIGAAPDVRLACQTRPTHNVAITPLLPATASAKDAYRPGGVQGHEQEVAVMFVDLRGSTRLGEARLPYDVVFILNQFFAEMYAALKATGGHYAQFSGDGLMALYGLGGTMEDGCRNALRGALEMGKRLDSLNQRLAHELNEPLRMGIGVHSGEAIVGTMGPPASPNLSAIGDSINIAARLESLTKTYDCALVVSVTTAERADIDLTRYPRHAAEVRGRGEPVEVYAIERANSVQELLPPMR